MKKLLLFLTSVVFLANQSVIKADAKDYTKWNLPEGATTRLAKGRINDIVYAPDGKQFAVSTNIGIWIYDALTGVETELIKEPGRAFRKIAFSPDGNTLACSSGFTGQGAIMLWDKATGKFMHTLRAPIGLASLYFSEDSNKLICAGYFGQVSVWEIKADNPPILNSNIELDFKSWSEFWPFTLSPDGRFLAITTPDLQTKDYSIKLYDGMTGELLHTLADHRSSVKSLSFSPDSKTLLSGDGYNSIRAWNTVTGELKTSMYWMSVKTTNVLEYSHNGKFIVSLHDDGVRLWQNTDDESDNAIYAIGEYKNIMYLDEHSEYVYKVAFSPDENTLITGSMDGTIRAWDTATGNQRFECKGHLQGIKGVVLSDTRETLLTINNAYNPMGSYQQRRWNVNTGEILSSVVSEKIYWGNMVISPDGKTLASHQSSGNCFLWNIALDGPQLITTFDLQGYRRGGLNVRIAFSPDGKMLAAGGEDFAVHVWTIDDESNTLTHKFTSKEHTKAVWSIAFSPDGNKLASGGEDKLIRIWDVEEGKTLFTLGGHSWRVNCFAFSPDCKILASGSLEIFLWDIESETMIRKIREQQRSIIFDLAFSPDGKILLIAANDGLKVYSIDSERFLTLNRDRTDSLRLSPENNTLVTYSWNADILLWDWQKVQKMLYDR